MLDQVNIPDSDDWWLMRLAWKLGKGLPRMHQLQGYRDGKSLLPAETIDAAMSEQYFRFMKRGRLHVAETLRDSQTDRQQVTAFRTAASSDENGDMAAQAIFDRSRFGVQQVKLFQDVGDFAAAYVITVPNAQGKAVWTLKNEWTTISEQHPDHPWLALASISVSYNAIRGTEEIALFRNGYMRIAYRVTPVPTLPTDGTEWYPSPEWTWAGPPIRMSHVVDPLVTKFSSLDGHGIYEKHLDTLDRINEITLNALTLIVMQSFRQRAVLADLDDVYPEDHPKAGQTIDYDEIFRTGPAALWTLPSTAKMWESAGTDVRPVYDARRDELKALCTVTRTPMSIFDSGSANQSATGSEISHQPLITAVHKRNRIAGASFAQAMAVSFQIEGDATRSDYTQIETEFAKPNPSTLAEKAEAAPKLKQGGATQAYIDAEVLEMTPAQRRAAADQRVDDAFVAALREPTNAG